MIPKLYNRIRKAGRCLTGLSVMAWLLVSCSYIPESERLIPVLPASVNRNVLIEDFTGQRCMNCPTASDIIEGLVREYGEETVVPVAIHSGPLGFVTNERFKGLKTVTGDEYFARWESDHQPVGMIDRKGLTDYPVWGAKVYEELQKPSTVDIAVSAHVTDSGLDVAADVTSLDGEVNGRLQLWVVEDSVTAFQMMPDGTRKDDYVHRHVFRAAVNGTWGEDISVRKGETVSRRHEGFILDDEWNKGRMYVVAFVYDERGVLQVVRKNLSH